MLECFLIKLQSIRPATLLKRGSNTGVLDRTSANDCFLSGTNDENVIWCQLYCSRFFDKNIKRSKYSIPLELFERVFPLNYAEF